MTHPSGKWECAFIMLALQCNDLLFMTCWYWLFAEFHLTIMAPVWFGFACFNCLWRLLNECTIRVFYNQCFNHCEIKCRPFEKTRHICVYSILLMPSRKCFINANSRLYARGDKRYDIYLYMSHSSILQCIPRNMHTVLLCFALLWLCNPS